MTKERIFELQLIDCNCTDCKHMVRDFDTYRKWEQWNKELQEKNLSGRKPKRSGLQMNVKINRAKKHCWQ